VSFKLKPKKQMLKIRLSRGGRKKLPYYRILVTNATSPRDSKFLEKIGTYNPLLADEKENRITVDKERAEHWLSVGAQPTQKVAKFLLALGVKGAEKFVPNFKPKNKGEGLKKKALARVAKEKEAANAAAAESAAAAEAPKAEETTV
jgi:small subunit ribosomal protein S16